MGSHQFVNLAESKELEHLDTTNMKNLARIIPVGTTVPKSCAQVLRTKFPGVEIQNVYAQTESGFLAWSSSLEKLGTIPPGVTIKVFIITEEVVHSQKYRTFLEIFKNLTMMQKKDSTYLNFTLFTDSGP